METSQEGPQYEKIGFCSESCPSDFSRKVKEYPLQEVGTNIGEFGENLRKLLYSATLNALESERTVRAGTISRIQRAISLETRDWRGIPLGINPDGTLEPKHLKLATDFLNLGYSALALNLEKCGRSLDAAQIYETKLKNYDKAKQLREKDKQITHKTTNIVVNLNDLLKQVRDGGIVAGYRCPHCNGTLKINKQTSLESLKTCDYCHSEIETVDLADFLKTALS